MAMGGAVVRATGNQTAPASVSAYLNTDIFLNLLVARAGDAIGGIEPMATSASQLRYPRTRIWISVETAGSATNPTTSDRIAAYRRLQND